MGNVAIISESQPQSELSASQLHPLERDKMEKIKIHVANFETFDVVNRFFIFFIFAK